MKKNLPVILLKGSVLLPNHEIQLEFENEESKSILEVAEMFHDKQLLVVTSNNPLEESPKHQEFSRIGVIAKMKKKIDLPSGATRVILVGMKRAMIYEYLNLNRPDEILESIVEVLPKEELPKNEEVVLVSKLYREIETIIRTVPYMSNSMLAELKKQDTLADMTDMMVPYLPLTLERLQAYLVQLDPKKRATMLLEDIYEQGRVFDIERELDSKVQEEIDQNQKDFILREKMRLIKEELGDGDTTMDMLKEQIEALPCPEQIRTKLLEEYRRLSGMQPMSPDANIVRTYIEWFLDLPWQTFTVDNAQLQDVKNKLDESHAGLEQVKTRIIEFLAVREMTKQLNSPIICLVGPPGVGKTTLAYSVAKAMNRKFVKLSVGGMSDESEIMGHRRTYLGANPGRIISSMKKVGSNNPVFLIDEIDKMTKGIHGDPASSLLEVLDPTQNKYFVDRYLEEEYDLSQVMFMVTANYMEDIPEALLDRLEIIELSGYTELEKLDIAKKHLLPSICATHGILEQQVTIRDSMLLEMIRYYTREAGVRDLKRQLETVIRKIVTEIIMQHRSEPCYSITKDRLVAALGKRKYPTIDSNSKSIGVVNGLAYTSYGGDTLAIEVNHYPGTGQLVLTGSLGDVMKESAKIALSYLKANDQTFQIPYDLFTKHDIHIHVPEGAIKKDGPSAGIALTTALVSALTMQKVPHTLAMTGEITLRGKVLPIGGLKEKSIGAVRSGIKTVILPYDNKRDLDDIPNEVRKKLQYHFVKTYQEVFDYVWKKSERTVKTKRKEEPVHL